LELSAPPAVVGHTDVFPHGQASATTTFNTLLLPFLLNRQHVPHGATAVVPWGLFLPVHPIPTLPGQYGAIIASEAAAIVQCAPSVTIFFIWSYRLSKLLAWKS
jgi:hypothetical protein